MKPGFSFDTQVMYCLKLFVEIARRAGDIDSSRHAALAVLDALYDARGFAAFGTVR